jgi:hypothetical protein
LDEPKNIQTNLIDNTSNGSSNQPPEQRLAIVPSRNGCFKVLGHGDHRPLEMVTTASMAYQVDLDGYIPILHNRAKLIENCEAIERNAAHEEERHRHPKRAERTTRKNAKTKTAQANTQKLIVLITKVFTVVSTGKTRRTQPLTVSP